MVLVVFDLVYLKQRLLNTITEADQTASDILDGVIAPSRIGGLRNRLRSVKILGDEFGI